MMSQLRLLFLHLKPANAISGIKFLCITLLVSVLALNFNYYPKIKADAVRDVVGDLYADVILGKRDFGEVSLNKTVSHEIYNPGGVIIDNSVPEGRMYVWDSGNNRIIGIDLATATGPTYEADVVIGQPFATDWAACNQDSSFQNDPDSSVPNASTLCGVPDYTKTIGEDKTFSNMFVDGDGNLYVPDIMNNRVLKYNNPFEEDSVADEVWGQPDFSGQRCNLTMERFQYPFPDPTNTSVCFSYWDGAGGGGAVIDPDGNLWIADSMNNRLLRFPESGGTISKTADIVIGQTDFVTGPEQGGSGLNKLSRPQSIRFDFEGNMYVADTGNQRVLKYEAPFVTGEAGVALPMSFDETVESIEMSIDKTRIFTLDPPGPTVDEWDLDGNLIQTVGSSYNWCGGSIGVDLNDNVYFCSYTYAQHVRQFVRQGDDSYEQGIDFFHDQPGIDKRQFNEVAADRMMGPAGTSFDGDRLYVADGRLLFWNDKNNLTNGQIPDGYLNAPSFVDLPNGGYVYNNQIHVDSEGRLWAVAAHEFDGARIDVFLPPISSGDAPDLSISGTLDVLGGGEVVLGDAGSFEGSIGGMTITEDGEYLWVAQTYWHRVLRIRDPLTDPVVDVVIGQEDTTGDECNRGLASADGSADPSYLCLPSYLSLDNFNNLYISDHFFEFNGNKRVLMFTEDTFPDDLVSALFAPSAKKGFDGNGAFGASFETAFDSQNRMVLGYNPYTNFRYTQYFENPEEFNPSDPFDTDFNTPAGTLSDFYGWPTTLAFDEDDNLYIGDGNRGKMLVYFEPFQLEYAPIIAQVTPVPTPTSDTTPNYTFSSNKAGTISYTGGCTSSTTSAVAGNNTITFNTLAAGTYSNCKITVTDSDLQASNELSVSPFTVNNCAFLKTKGDFNCNHTVDLSDLSILASYWLLSNTVADANGNNFTDLTDLSILSFNWLQSF